eukprot:GFYU01002212.1.p1 GENE.GFYU01002212.1~~GFYU01002212.1.p1  ORF type:complete len:753 (-),score=306.90 GFYU01002212.1:155-2413(-)
MASNNPVLPQPGKRNVLITSALPYVNNVPHLGNIIGCVLSADVYARFCRLRGDNCIYVCGTDEYGTATETKALAEGVTPKEICDKYHKIHKEIYEWFECSFDHFGRTSTEKQTQIAQDIFWKNYNNGYTLEDVLEQLYCTACARYLADRFVEGTCPHCAYEDARGDQCDNCGKLLNPTELLKPRCKQCNQTPEIRKTEHMFLDLPKMNDRLHEFVNTSSVKGSWSSNSTQVTQGWIRDGLKPRCITRDLKWGTPVPLEKYSDKVFYVWFDAPIGYISITMNYTDQWEQWWKNPENVELYQFMGKDNIPFHTVIFPCSLLGTGDPYTMLHHISTTEYLNYEDGKFSKSRGTGVFGDDVKATGIPAEIWRYYLLANRPEISDSEFKWDDFMAKNNGELLNNLGNFCFRCISFCFDRLGQEVPMCTKLNDGDREFMKNCQDELDKYVTSLTAVHLKDGLKLAMATSALGNQYFQHNTPWKVLADDPERASTVISVCIHLVRVLATLMQPYMPSFSRKVYNNLSIPEDTVGIYTFNEDSLNLQGHKLVNKPEHLIRKIDPKEINELRKRFGSKDGAPAPGPSKKSNNKKKEKFVVNHDEYPLDTRVGKILEVNEHPSAERLFVTKVDLGEEQRQIVAGLREIYTADELVGRTVVAVCNLKAAKLKGVESQGMLLTAQVGEKVELLTVKGEAPLGTAITAGDAPQKIFANLEKKQFDTLVLAVGEDGNGIYGGKHPIRVNADVPVGAVNAVAGAKIC